MHVLIIMINDNCPQYQDLAKHHIEQAWYAATKVAQVEDDVRYESASVLAELMMERAMSSSSSAASEAINGARQVLRKVRIYYLAMA